MPFINGHYCTWRSSIFLSSRIFSLVSWDIWWFCLQTESEMRTKKCIAKPPNKRRHIKIQDILTNIELFFTLCELCQYQPSSSLTLFSRLSFLLMRKQHGTLQHNFVSHKQNKPWIIIMQHKVNLSSTSLKQV